MNVSAAIVHIRNGTGHDVDGQVNDTTMLLPWIELEARRVRRELSLKVPEIFTLTAAPIVVAAGSTSFNIASQLTSPERILEVARLVRGTGSAPSSDEWVDVPVYEEGVPWLGYREEGPIVNLLPGRSAAGTYRVRYVQGMSAAAFTTSTDLNGGFSPTIVGLPAGLEDIVVERVSARASRRIPGDDPAPHLAEAERIWREQLPALRKRYGRSVKPGFRRMARIA